LQGAHYYTADDDFANETASKIEFLFRSVFAGGGA